MSSDIARAEQSPKVEIFGIALDREQVEGQPIPFEGVIMSAEDQRLEVERIANRQKRDAMLQAAAEVEKGTIDFAAKLSDVADSVKDAADKSKEKAELVSERATELDNVFTETESALDKARMQVKISSLDKQSATNEYLDAVDTRTTPFKMIIPVIEEAIAYRPASIVEAEAHAAHTHAVIIAFAEKIDPKNKAQESALSLLVAEVVKYDRLIEATDKNDSDLRELLQRQANHDAANFDNEQYTENLEKEKVRGQINDRQLQLATNTLRGKHSKAEDRNSLQRAYDALKIKLALRGIGKYALYGNDILAPKPVPGTTPLEIEA